MNGCPQVWRTQRTRPSHLNSTGERTLENPFYRDLQSERTGIGTGNDLNHSQSWLRRPEDAAWAPPVQSGTAKYLLRQLKTVSLRERQHQHGRQPQPPSGTSSPWTFGLYVPLRHSDLSRAPKKSRRRVSSACSSPLRKWSRKGFDNLPRYAFGCTVSLHLRSRGCTKGTFHCDAES